MKQSSLSWLLALLLAVSVSAYDMVGSWQLVGASRYQSLGSSLTFQFAKNADASGSITTKLFVYDCFLSQFLYDAEEDRVTLSFQTSSLLTADCSLAPINELRAQALKVFFFQVQLDRLLLLSLNGETVFQLVRQKFDYTKIMTGVWTMTGSSAASFPARINSSAISMCADQAQLTYSVATINGSYPRLAIANAFSQGVCADQSFLKGLLAAKFLQVAQNLTQLTLFDANCAFLMVLDKVANIEPNKPLTASKPQQPTQSSSNIATSNTASSQSNMPAQIAKPKIPAASTPIPSTSTSASYTSTSSYTPVPIATPQVSQQTTILQPQQAQIQIQSQSQSIQSVQPIQQTIAPSPVQPSPAQTASNPSTFTWVFNQDNIFSGSFSSAPLFSYDPSPPSNNQQANPSQSYEPPQNNPPSQVTQSTIRQDQVSSQQTPTNNQSQNGADFQLSDAFFSDFGATAFTQQEPTYVPPPSTPSPSPSPSTATAANTTTATTTVTVSQLISRSMSGGDALPMGQFVGLNKWLLIWLNGVNSLQQIGVVYIIFTPAKIILYCPCNTYYTNYLLEGNSLRGISWKGTSNQCEFNNDRRVTDYIFYATALRQRGKNLAFYYNSQAALAEFQPYY